MITASANYKTSATAPVKTTRVILTQQGDDTPIVFTNADDLMSVKVDAVGLFLGTGTKKMTVKLLGLHPELSNDVYGLQVGLLRANGTTWDDIPLGIFNTFEVALDYEAKSTTATFYDAMWYASQTLYSTISSATYPMTVQTLATTVATALNVTLASGFSSLPNASYSIAEDPYALIDGFTLRDVIDEIAKATATSAIISGSTLKFVKYATPTETLTSDNLKKLKIGAKYGVINSVVLSRQPQEDNIALTDDTSVSANGLTEFKIVNNEILDDDRASLITPIYNVLNGISFQAINAETEGHGWYEMGDTLTITQDAQSYKPIVTEIHLVLEGSLKETIICTIPDASNVNRATVGGIMRSIYNTEIKTDKQNQQITSVVSRMDTLDDTVAENYSLVQQTINEITQTIQSTGGNNLIKNSVGYAVNTDNTLTSWTKSGTGNVTANTSPESVSYGALSGNQINIDGASAQITQRIFVQAGGKYSLSVRVKKNATGSAEIKLSNPSDSFVIPVNASTSYLWQELSIVNISPTLGYLDITIKSNSAIAFAFTDLMLVQGTATTKWQQANGEILNTQVALNSDGIRVKSNIYAGDYVQITPLEFAGYSNASGSQQKVFSLNRDTTELQKLSVKSQITMPPIKIVPIPSGARAGWAFVKVVG